MVARSRLWSEWTLRSVAMICSFCSLSGIAACYKVFLEKIRYDLRFLKLRIVVMRSRKWSVWTSLTYNLTIGKLSTSH
jgi:hypothetical protein